MRHVEIPIEGQVRQQEMVDGEWWIVDGDTTQAGASDVIKDTLTPESVPTDRTLWVPRSTIKDNGWTLAVAYQKTGHRGDMSLPSATAETNPIVYDSLVLHHAPLTLSLMLSRRLDSHWQVGVGLRYQRMTSDMLSGNLPSTCLCAQRWKASISWKAVRSTPPPSVCVQAYNGRQTLELACNMT